MMREHDQYKTKLPEAANKTEYWLFARMNFIYQLGWHFPNTLPFEDAEEDHHIPLKLMSAKSCNGQGVQEQVNTIIALRSK